MYIIVNAKLSDITYIITHFSKGKLHNKTQVKLVVFAKFLDDTKKVSLERIEVFKSKSEEK